MHSLLLLVSCSSTRAYRNGLTLLAVQFVSRSYAVVVHYFFVLLCVSYFIDECCLFIFCLFCLFVFSF
jgi:hypothetical protein